MIQDPLGEVFGGDGQAVATADPLTDVFGPAPEPTLMERIGGGVDAALSGGSNALIQGLAALPDALGIVTEKAGRAVGSLGLETAGAGLSGCAQDVRDVAESDFPTPEAAKGTFWGETAPKAVGSGLSFLLPGAGLGALGVRAIPAMAALGAMVEAPTMYREAKANGADEETATLAFLGGGVIGTTEAFGGLGSILARINTRTGGRLIPILSSMVAEAGEEAVQEGLQTTLENLLAKNLYDEDRKALDGVMEAGVAGGFAGAVLSVLVSALPGDQHISTTGAGTLQPQKPGMAEPGPAPVASGGGEAAPVVEAAPAQVGTIPEDYLAANRRAAGSDAVQAEPVEPTRPEHVWAREVVRARGGEFVLARPTEGKLRLPAMYDPATGSVVLSESATGEEAVRSLVYHELTHALKARSEATWEGLYDEIAQIDPEGHQEAQAEYAALWASQTGQQLTPELAREEGQAYYAENLVHYLQAVEENPQRLARLAESQEGRGLLRRIADSLLDVLDRLTGGRVKSVAGELRRLKAELAGTALEERLSPVQAIRAAQAITRGVETLQAMPGVEKPTSSPQEAQTGPDAAQDTSAIRAFHGTTAEPFKQIRVPAHFGTEAAAKARIEGEPEFSRRFGVEPKGTPRVVAVQLDIKNPLRITEGSSGLYTPADLVDRSVVVRALTFEEGEAIKALPRAEQTAALADALEAKGYDGLVYRNEVEDPGSDSYIVLRSEQARPEGGRFAVSPPEDSPAFKRWFGQSKVVDESGKPLVVYHGAPDTRGLTVFRAITRNNSEFWFSDSRKTAATYADDRRAFDYQGAEPGILSVYLSLQNPLEIKASELSGEKGKTHGGALRDAVKQAKDAGHDGLIIRGLSDDYPSGGSRSNHYVAFRPEQIKSATGNRGTFDPTNPDIRFAVSREALSSVEGFVQANLTSRGNLPESVFRSMLQRDSRVAATIQGLRFAALDFRRALRKVYGSVKKAPAIKLDEALRNDALVPLLDPRLHAPVRAMRAHIDALSRAMIDAGVVEGELAGKIESNMGVYLTRSYRVFDDPKWADKVPESVRNKAKALIRSEYPDYTEDQVEGTIRALLYQGKAADTPIALLSRSKLGSKDLSILRKRMEIAPEIRALYGEYKEPLVNYARSVTKMAHLIANHQFLEEVRSSGLSEGFLTEEATPENYKQIAADESHPMHPLNGLYTSPEIERAFREAVERQHVGTLMRGYMRVNGAVKYGKTVGSVMTQVRNFFGNVGFLVAQGHYRAGPFVDAAKAIATKFGAITEQGWRDYYTEALRYGVMHEGANSQELRAVLDDAMKRDVDSVLIEQAGALSKAAALATNVYQVNDDFWKIVAWENEQARYAKAHPEWTEAQVKAHAAEIVRNTFPTYSLVPKTVRAIRRFPLVGSFVSFPAEIFRTSYHTSALIRSELADPRTRGIGAQRLAGSMLATTGAAAIAAATRYLLGITRDDDENFREFLPPWSENSSIAYVGRSKDGKPLWVDLSYSDPYSYLKKPIVALLRGDDPLDGARDALSELLDPFLGEEILAGALLDIARNKKKTGGEVYNESAPVNVQAEQIAEHLGKAIEPGTLSSLRRIHNGLTGYVSPYGRSYDPAIEALATFGGVRVSEMDVPQALQFKAREYQRSMSDATRLLSSVAKRRGTIPEAELRAAHENMEATRKAAFDAARKSVLAAQALGVSQEEIFTALTQSVSPLTANQLIGGEYVPHRTRSGQYSDEAMSTIRDLEGEQ